MNRLIKLGLVSLLALPIVGCAKQEKVRGIKFSLFGYINQ